MADTDRSHPSDNTDPASESSVQQIADSPLVLLAILFFATGALGLPLLWRSGAFGRFAKITLSIILTVYTITLLILTAWVIAWGWRLFQTAP